MSRIYVSLALVLCAAAPAANSAAAQQSAPTKLARWMEMAGCWQIQGRELNNSVDTFQQTGIGRIWVQNSTRVRVDRRLMVHEATGALATIPRNRQFAEVYYEITSGRIVAEEADAPDPVATRRTVLLSPTGDAIFSTFLSNSAGTVNTIMWRLVSNDRIESETRARDPHGSFWSDYAQVWTRLPASDTRCKAGPDQR